MLPFQTMSKIPFNINFATQTSIPSKRMQQNPLVLQKNSLKLKERKPSRK
jgi:hypothetical protein